MRSGEIVVLAERTDEQLRHAATASGVRWYEKIKTDVQQLIKCQSVRHIWNLDGRCFQRCEVGESGIGRVSDLLIRERTTQCS